MYTTMASLQHRISGGYKYWYIVESRRVNGKPRPIPLLYLGKADDILKRLQGGICSALQLVPHYKLNGRITLIMIKALLCDFL